MKPPVRSLLSCLIALAVLAAGACRAQSEPAALSKLRSDFELRARLTSGALNDYYERALASLETTLAASGDYEQARIVKTRREELSSKGSAAATVSANTLPLNADAAKLTGPLSVKGGELQGWRTSTCAADWTLSKFTPGAYQLQFTYSLIERPQDTPTPNLRPQQPVEEAMFSFREMSLLSGAAKNSRSLKLASTKAGETRLFTIEAPLDLTRAPVTLRLAPEASYPANLIVIRDLKLIPVITIPTTNATTSNNTLASEWQQLQQSKSKRLAAARKPIIDAYVANLAGLLPPGSSNEEAASRIETEKRRVLRLIEDASGRNSGGMKLDNYEDVTGALFVPDPGNSGDRFKIEYEGRQLFIRLAWVTCPPLDPSDRKRMKTTTERFSADELEMLDLGRNAQEFTALYLEGHLLHLLVKPSKKPDEDATALVFLDDIGLFQSVLIDHGLAVVDAPSSLGRGSMEAGLLKGMQDRETAAKRQKPPPGGWALKDTP